MGKIKQPCCIGSADTKALKPICEDGLGCYSVLVANGIAGALPGSAYSRCLVVAHIMTYTSVGDDLPLELIAFEYLQLVI